MKVGDMSLERFAAQLAGAGAAIRWGPFVSRIVSKLPELAAPLHLLYADFPLEPPGGICDFHVRMRPRSLRLPWTEQQVEFLLDGVRVFQPVPRRSALTVFEWRLNWCVYALANYFLIYHAAVVERDGFALLLPGHSGVGKSTSCAGLVTAGWRLLSDELALLDPNDGRLRPLARPISLKNQSIEIVKRIAPEAVFGPVATDTSKGRVAHMKPPTSSVRRAGQLAPPRLIVLPRFMRDAELRLAPLSKAEMFFRLAETALNYEMHGEQGFRAMIRLINASECYQLEYSSLNQAVTAINDLVRSMALEAQCRTRTLPAMTC
jgi:HprK-related kinase A